MKIFFAVLIVGVIYWIFRSRKIITSTIVLPSNTLDIPIATNSIDSKNNNVAVKIPIVSKLPTTKPIVNLALKFNSTTKSNGVIIDTSGTRAGSIAEAKAEDKQYKAFQSFVSRADLRSGPSIVAQANTLFSLNISGDIPSTAYSIAGNTSGNVFLSTRDNFHSGVAAERY